MKTKQERSELFKLFQANIKKKNSFEEGKQYLLTLRAELSAVYDYVFSTCSNDDFCKMPLAKDKTIAYYIYHLIRIEDITSNALIVGQPQIFFTGNFYRSLNSPVITTGNEINRDGLVEFSKMINIDELRNYAYAVLNNTNTIIQSMSFEESKVKVSEQRKTEVIKTQTVSNDESAFWLVDYWCKKTYAGLFLMPFSRHHMLHLNGCLRILDKIKK